VVVHSRDAWDETIECLAEFRPERAVMHCYLGDYDTALRVLAACPGAVFAFGGSTTYRRNDMVRDAAARLPLDRILVETDAPFLSPEPVRGQINEPAHIRHTLEAIKKLRPEPGEEVERVIYENSREFFGIAA
jgi:TatD DNase family protein